MQNMPFLNNNLFTSYTLEIDFPKTYDFESNKQEARNALDSIKVLYDKDKFINQNEHQFEDDFIAKVLEILGWQFIRQDEKIIQGKMEKPDFLLFADMKCKEAYEKIPKQERQSSNTHIAIILESKAYNVEIDNKKVKNNPHFQLLRYLSNLKLDFGFLSNGRMWRFYDNSKLSAQKIFYEVNLESIILDDNLNAFNYFYHIFNAKNFSQDIKSTMKEALEKNAESKTNIEDDLQSVIYGTNGKDSIFEKIGALLYKANKEATLQEIYENSIYFTFRLLFIAYFEDKFNDILDKHSCFKDEISLYKLLDSIKEAKENSYKGIGKLEDIFRIYNEGKPNFDMPIFNGGLFDESKTHLFDTPKVFNDKDLLYILESLFYFKDSLKIYKRDYRTLSVSHLGTIYEGLLSYFFSIADEDIFYITYAPKKHSKTQSIKSIEGYFDSYDYAKIEKDFTIHHTQNYKKGQIYLKNTSNSRKISASFYTPEQITNFLVKYALKDTLNDENILHFKILDNSCGSGHFLVEALNHITQIVLNSFESFPTLKSLYDKERETITQNVTKYIENYEIDESDILKRLLLKRVIFGVDLNPFSIELTKLSLWIDSFIFGTPLSFVEHHIKCGNALIGTSINNFKNYYNTLQQKKSKEEKGQSLFINHFLNEFNALSLVFDKLDSIKDNTEQDIKESKHIYKNEIIPILDKLNLFLNLYNAKSFMNNNELIEFARLESSNIEHLANKNEKEWQKLRDIIESYAKKYRFFNYEIEFPELIKDCEFIGFEAIVGNPPWDKTKFSDSDFFPQYQSNYRTLSNSAKKEISTNLLAKSYIKQEYEAQKAFIESCNNYYKAHYPLNRGSGDGNLFRFFVEKNLSLLAKDANLSYVLPSALMLEEGSFALRKEILENNSLNIFYSFENRDSIFPDVHRSYKFALMQVRNTKANNTHIIKTMFYKTNIKDIENKDNILQIALNDIKLLSPNQLAMQEVRTQRDLEILKKCYASFKPLSAKWLDFRRELDMTNDKDLFIESYKEGLLPLYEGKMIHQYNANFSEAQYFLDSKEFDNRLRSKEIYRLKQDLNIDNKEYEKLIDSILQNQSITKNELEDSIIKYDKSFYRLAFRAIASDTNERTIIFSILPKNCGCGNSLWSSQAKKYILDSKGHITYKPTNHLQLLFALGIFNSLIVDFIARGMIQINVNKVYLERLPIPQPNNKEILESTLYKNIALDALKLQLFNDSNQAFKELQQEFNLNKTDILNTKKAYDILKAKLDISIARDIYKLSKDEFCYMLKSFKVLSNKQPGYIALLESLWE